MMLFYGAATYLCPRLLRHNPKIDNRVGPKNLRAYKIFRPYGIANGSNNPIAFSMVRTRSMRRVSLSFFCFICTLFPWSRTNNSIL
jgi:hypothetical protein